MKRKLNVLLLFGLIILSACSMGVNNVLEESMITDPTHQVPLAEEVDLVDYFCKFTPLSPECYTPSDDLNFISPIEPEYTIDETFEFEMINQMPSNWLLYSNPEYKAGGVSARVVQMDGFRAVHMYSDGLQKPPYPQAAATPTFIFTTKFNLDIDRKGVAIGSLMVPSTEGNSVTMGVSTGAVNTISVTIDRDMNLSVKTGGPFFYYSGNNDAGDTIPTGLVLQRDQWYTFVLVWDAEINQVQAYLVDLDNEELVLLHEGPFHISNRYNAEASGAILVPNVFRVTMPSGRNLSGYSYLAFVKVDRKVTVE